MKITDTQQSTAAPKVERDDQRAVAGKKGAAAKAPQQDRIEFSKTLDSELEARKAEQAKRVEEIKTQLQTGKYQVNSRDVAEKMLSRHSQKEES
jgi:flagellar biosynthesis anti-sigma factor FlgM